MNDTTTSAPAVIHVNFDNKLDYKSAKFSFREVKDEATGVKTKRAPVELAKMPVPSIEGIVAILEAGGKQLELLLEAVESVVAERARDIINDNSAVTTENFDLSLLDWNVIANLEKEDRRSKFAKEFITDFAADYVSVMPAISGTTKEQCANVAKILSGKFSSVKAHSDAKNIINKLKLRLSLYIEHTPKAEEFAEFVDFLLKKADSILSAKEENLVDNLGL